MSSLAARMLSRDGQGGPAPSLRVGPLIDSRNQSSVGTAPSRNSSARPEENFAVTATSSQVGSATYHRIMIDGDEGDKDYAKCADIIASVVHARQVYKSMDKGQAEDRLTEQEMSQIPLVALEGSTLSASHTKPSPALHEYVDGSQSAVNMVSASLRLGSPREGEAAAASSPPVLSYVQGVYQVSGSQTVLVSWAQYIRDVRALYGAIENGPCLSTARRRLITLGEKFQLYSLMNSELESTYDPFIKGGGVYARCTRVDNALRLKTSIPAPLFLDFVARTAMDQPQMPLFTDETTGKDVTFMSYFESGGVVNPQEVTIEGLGLHPTLYRNKFLPYDMFDKRMNPAGEFGAKLLQAVLSTSGPSNGDLCGALVRAELERREFRPRQLIASETSLEFFGHNPNELPALAAWVQRQSFNGYSRNMWTLTISRAEPQSGPNSLPNTCQTIGDQLRYIFYPMFMASLYPRDPRWADVAQLLAHTGALSILTGAVSRRENLSEILVSPDSIQYRKSCSDYYFFYFVWCNLTTLNALRTRLGLNTFFFNPSVHEPAPAYDQLVCSFLLGDVVYHVSSLQKSWIMQYLYLYCRIGIVMSPLRDNVLSTPYFDHPVVNYFRQGMRVSISTSDPLHFHHRLDQPLIEEYATLMKLRSLTAMDLCELARNSVLNSNFPRAMQESWLGSGFAALGASDNDMSRSCVCDCRLQFRHESLTHEETLLNLVLSKAPRKPGEPPLSVSVVPFSQSVQVSDVVQQFRSARRMNYADRRVVYPRIDIYGGYTERPATEAVEMLRHVLSLRKKYTNFRVVDVNVEDVFTNSQNFDEDVWEHNNYYGVFLLSRVGKSPSWPAFIPPVQDFIRDVETVRKAVSSAALRRLATHRLNLLERKFLMHISMNVANEAGAKEEKEWNNRDFYSAHKVDTNVQTDAGHNARTLLEFFVDKAMNHGEDVVFEEDNSPITLRQLLTRYSINVNHITVDELNHQISTHPDLKSIFLSPHNFMQGRYFAELIKHTLNIYKEDEYSFAEYRLTLLGNSPNEWYDLAHWFDQYGMASPQSRWIVCFPRQYRRLRREGKVRNFGELLDNFFKPLWEISLHPASDTKFHYLLAHISGFDCCDDESKIDLPLTKEYPHDWSSDYNPPYNMYLYYLWANIATLNSLRAERGLGTFTFRPQCGELGGLDHLIGGFLLANGINHGVTLASHPAFEYIYYITQLGVAMSPLSNTAGASAYLENPFPIFFHRGLNVSLATNQPSYFHFTREPLVEEYSIAAKLWKLEFNDLSEIARNSVLQSGFPPAWKARALGPLYQLRSTLGNDVRRSRVSDIRVAYRYEVYHTELNFLDEQLSSVQRMPRAMQLPRQEAAAYELATTQFPGGPKKLARQVSSNKQFLSSVLGGHAALRGVATTVGAGGDEADVEGAAAPVSAEQKAMSLQSEIARLDAELAHVQAVTQQVAGHNSTIATAVNRLRARLKNEGLSILGSLQQNEKRSGDGRGSDSDFGDVNGDGIRDSEISSRGCNYSENVNGGEYEAPIPRAGSVLPNTFKAWMSTSNDDELPLAPASPINSTPSACLRDSEENNKGLQQARSGAEGAEGTGSTTTTDFPDADLVQESSGDTSTPSTAPMGTLGYEGAGAEVGEGSEEVDHNEVPTWRRTCGTPGSDDTDARNTVAPRSASTPSLQDAKGGGGRCNDSEYPDANQTGVEEEDLSWVSPSIQNRDTTDYLVESGTTTTESGESGDAEEEEDGVAERSRCCGIAEEKDEKTNGSAEEMEEAEEAEEEEERDEEDDAQSCALSSLSSANRTMNVSGVPNGSTHVTFAQRDSPIRPRPLGDVRYEDEGI